MVGKQANALMNITEYNIEQMEALAMVRDYLRGLPEREIDILKGLIEPYLDFRRTVSRFQHRHLEKICSDKCFISKSSACCNRDGIATFFADVAINCMVSAPHEMDLIEHTISNDEGGFKCVYLSENGCVWRLKPIVCEMFLCDHAKESLSKSGQYLKEEWERLRLEEKSFTWPDSPVLFDRIEDLFLEAGYESPIMYLHKSPGLLRVKSFFKK